MPSIYWLWLGGLAWTTIGVNLLSFGMVWTATAHSGLLAGVVLFSTTLPRVILALFGGAVADRLGPLRLMFTSDAAMSAFCASAAALVVVVGPHPALLIGVALMLGIADAFYYPAAGAVPKFLVPSAGLPRALSARQLVIFAGSVAGPALGGVAVSAAGLPLSLALGSAGFAGMLLILAKVRRRMQQPAHQNHAATPSDVIGQMRAGLRFALTTPLLRAVVLVTSAFALFVLPLTSIMVPLVARDRGWEAELAGVTAGVFSAGMAALALWVMWRSGAQRAGAAAICGMLITGAGILGFAAAHYEVWAILAVLVTGLGAGLFSAHLGPLFVAATAPEYMARVQSVMMIAQAAPMMIAGPVIGVLADLLPVGVIVLIWGAGALVVGCGSLFSRPLRKAQRPS
ncbi:MFS transporter [Nesterenkonia ebinurensis]|uniref:MFS transporter n=1 Tax=Nesterenkonia ebinurensis TaxID=2608252 RepID=UPI00168B9D7E|nr:MFS transporter [Nesterenkonia ebinurensis]